MNQKINEAIAATFGQKDPRREAFDRVIATVCAQHCVTRLALMSDIRRGDLWRARVDAWRILLAGGFTQTDIARAWRRNPSSICKTVKKHAAARTEAA